MRRSPFAESTPPLPERLPTRVSSPSRDARPPKGVTMGVNKYESRGRSFWQVDETLVTADGREVRLRKRRIPTKEQAVAFVAKARTDAFEGRYFERLENPNLPVPQASP